VSLQQQSNIKKTRTQMSNNNNASSSKKLSFDANTAAATEDDKVAKVLKSVVPKLEHSSLDQTWLRRIAQEELNLILSGIIGQKTLMLDPSLIGPLALIIPLSLLLNKMNVQKQIYRLDGIGAIPGDQLPKIENLVILTRPRLEYMKNLSRILQYLHKNYENEMKRIKIHLFFVPRRTLLCEIFLERSAVYHMFTTIGEYSLDLIPFDSNMLYLELPSCNRELILEGDTSSLYFTARSLMKLQACYGLIPYVKWIGKYGEQVWRMMRDMGERVHSAIASRGIQKTVSEIDEVILFDRQVDLISCLVTGLTYESLVDQMYGLRNNLITIEQLVEQKDDDGKITSQKKVQTKLPLNDDDQIFHEIRHLNFLGVGHHLQQVARVIEHKYEERKTLNEVREIKEYFKQLPQLQQKHKDLTTHLNIASKIKEMTLTHDFRKMIETEQNLILQEDERASMEYIENCIIRQDPLDKVLRLLCLMSLTKNGLSQKEFDHLRTELINSYGHFTLLTLDNLQKAGLLARNNGRGSWKTVRTSHNLMIRDIDERKQDDIGYVHSGYAPLSVRLIQKSQTPNTWTTLTNGKATFLQPNVPIGAEYQKNATADVGGSRKKRILCVFIGGVTKCEVSALKSLERGDVEYIIVSTGSAERLLPELFEAI
jgi:hypothetical protein